MMKIHAPAGSNADGGSMDEYYSDPYATRRIGCDAELCDTASSYVSGVLKLAATALVSGGDNTCELYFLALLECLVMIFRMKI
jgi:hypothetical protein